jgi:hypothetical protein
MAGLVPAIHVLGCCSAKDVDARDKRGHDDHVTYRSAITSTRAPPASLPSPS